MLNFLPERISKRVSITTGAGCWEWVGTRNKQGYGVIYWQGSNKLAHRIVKQLYGDSFPEHLLLRHLCHNPKCVNPQHTVAGTHKENMQDSVRSRTMASGSRNGHCSVTAEDIEVMKILRYHQNMTTKEIAAQFGVSQASVSRYTRDVHWDALRK